MYIKVINLSKKKAQHVSIIQPLYSNITHMVGRCTTLAPSEYTIRHNKVAGYIHWTIRKCMGLQVTEKCYEYISGRVISVSNTTAM